MTAGRSPDAPTGRAGDGHRMAAAEGHGSGKCVSVEDANRVLADERRGRDALIAAAEQRGRDETARKVETLEIALRDLVDRVGDACDPWTGTCGCPIGRARATLTALADHTEATT